jgi:alanyl-tRNA synthetase
VRQAGSAVRPDKLRFDFTHGHPLSAEELRDIEDRVNEWVKGGRPVRWMNMERSEAERLGAMALFGEKYGEWVRVVEVEEVSRELCGGTHVANTAEVGIFTITAEGSSAANVRRIEALTGPAAIDWFRDRAAELRQAGELLGSPQDPLAGARRAAERLETLSKGAAEAEKGRLADTARRLAESAEEIRGVHLVAGEAPIADQKQLLEMADRVRQSLGDAAVVLGGAGDGRVGIVACFAPEVVERGLSAAEVVREAAELVGGGGGGRDDVAQAGGKDPEKLAEALAAARQAIERRLTG